MSAEKSLPKEPRKIAIVTGASSGMGREFALQLEKEYFLDEVWLLARRKEPMKELAEYFTKSKGVVIQCDLNSEGDILALNKRLETEKPDLCFFVNNAGYGKIGPFSELGLDEQLQMIDLNVRALTQLTYIALPYMRPGACLFQVASAIAFSPAPKFAVYAATKSYVLSLGLALEYEMKDKGIHVITVCPGPVATEFFEVAKKNEYMREKAPPTAEPFNKAVMANAKDVVSKAIKDARKHKSISIFGLPIQLFSKASKFVPNALLMKFMSMR